MRKVKLTAHPKVLPESKNNQSKEINGEDVLERLTKFPTNPHASTYIQPIEESGEASSDLNIVEEPLSVEA